MSQTVITSAFEQLKAQQAVTGEAVVLDGFIFANVPNLDISSPIDPNEAVPPDAQIVHRADVALTGVVNDNAVVYSVTLGTAVGDFDFNWVGLVNKTSNVVAMIVHAPVQSKVANAAGVQGNVLTRSFLMEYDGAKKQTNITTPAQTWQIDFTARLDGIDERQRLENADIYGAAAFFGDGYLVGKTGNQFFVTKGTGYVAGLRTSLVANQNITVTTKPVQVWLDVCWTGSLTSVWNAQSKITVVESLADYVQNGVQHYVFAVASIDVNGNITDLRPKGTLNEQVASDALKKHEQSRNHPDATTSEKGFTRLSSATDSTSEELAATSKAVKIAMDNANARLAKERNGADIPNPSLFVQNIGLQDTVNKAAGAVQRTGDTMSGKLNLPQTSSFGVNTDNALGGNSIVIGDSDTGFKQESDGVIGIYSNNQKVCEITNALFTALVNLRIDGGLTVKNIVALDGDIQFASEQHRIYMPGVDDAGFNGNNLVIQSWFGIGLRCSMDHLTRIYFNTRDGSMGLQGELRASGGVKSGGAKLEINGDVYGDRWSTGNGPGWLSLYLEHFDSQIRNDLTSWVSNNFPTKADLSAYATTQWVLQNLVQDTRLGGAVFVGASANSGYASLTAPDGHVLTAILDGDTSRWPMPDSPDSAFARPMQKLINGQWITVGQL
ncbi:MAG TPA: phage tail protein [Citrobacter freundii]|nr:phage tail protein [Citrobacter freundii]HCM55566.1 phage tail protein [Citrobacter freundii]